MILKTRYAILNMNKLIQFQQINLMIVHKFNNYNYLILTNNKLLIKKIKKKFKHFKTHKKLKVLQINKKYLSTKRKELKL